MKVGNFFFVYVWMLFGSVGGVFGKMVVDFVWV